MVAVMIGIDPHKASHTAVAIDPAEVPLGRAGPYPQLAQRHFRRVDRHRGVRGLMRVDPDHHRHHGNVLLPVLDLGNDRGGHARFQGSRLALAHLL